MNLRYSSTRTMWIDMMWSLQHNSGTWVNKVKIPDRRVQFIIKKTRQVPMRALRHVLDDKREGHMKKVGEVAAYFNPKMKGFIQFLPEGKHGR